MTAGEEAIETLERTFLVRYIERLVSELRIQTDQRFEAQDKAILAAFAAAEKATDKTEIALREYKVGANEWRDTVKDLIANLRESDTVTSKEASMGASRRGDTWNDAKWLITTAILLAGAIIAYAVGRW